MMIHFDTYRLTIDGYEKALDAAQTAIKAWKVLAGWALILGIAVGFTLCVIVQQIWNLAWK